MKPHSETTDCRVSPYRLLHFETDSKAPTTVFDATRTYSKP